jgi:hypothetical protein
MAGVEVRSLNPHFPGEYEYPSGVRLDELGLKKYLGLPGRLYVRGKPKVLRRPAVDE